MAEFNVTDGFRVNFLYPRLPFCYGPQDYAVTGPKTTLSSYISRHFSLLPPSNACRIHALLRLALRRPTGFHGPQTTPRSHGCRRSDKPQWFRRSHMCCGSHQSHRSCRSHGSHRPQGSPRSHRCCKLLGCRRSHRSHQFRRSRWSHRTDRCRRSQGSQQCKATQSKAQNGLELAPGTQDVAWEWCSGNAKSTKWRTVGSGHSRCGLGVVFWQDAS